MSSCLLHRVVKVCVNINANAIHCRPGAVLLSSTSSWRLQLCRSLKMKKTPEMTAAATPYFSINDYDCVGFDLDHTLLKYNLANVVRLEYDILAHYLVEQKGYDAHYLLKPIDVDFLQKGLTLDYENGNVLQLAPDGSINRAAHGTKLLTDPEIEDLYGTERSSQLTQVYTQNILDAWNGPISERIRSLMDHFDLPTALAFARCVDNIDSKSENENIAKQYNLHGDITSGLVYMFQRNNFAENTGGYFPALKKNPELYIHRASENLCKWLKELKSQKKVFLVTGSNVDYASFISQYAFGEDWRDLFDIVVTFARKPGFFTGRRPFISLVDGVEKDLVQPEDVRLGNIYSQGNWQDLYELFKKEIGHKHPKCLYIGDNIIQDVFAPDEYTRCHTVAVSQEMYSEGVGDEKEYVDILASGTWGSYFTQRGGKVSLWCDLIQRHAAVCVPSVDVLSAKPLNFKIQSFKCSSPEESQAVGFFPKAPF